MLPQEVPQDSLTEWAYENKNYWNKVYAAPEYDQEEKVILVGSDGEEEFDKKILHAVRGKEVLDVGCGIGEFTLKIAEVAERVIGIDLSEQAIRRAEQNLARSKRRNAWFRVADANDLPLPAQSFDVVVSRRGPATASIKTLSEAYRVLRRGGLLMEITIGEKDKQNLARIFRRGQMYGIRQRVARTIASLIEQAGFQMMEVRECQAKEVFKTIEDLVIRLKSAPIIPDFSEQQDREGLSMIEKKFGTDMGIETDVHRVAVIARK